MGIQTCGGNDRLRTIWMPKMDHSFIDLKPEQVGKGDRTAEWSWKHMTAMFNAKFSFQHKNNNKKKKNDVLKNRYKTPSNLYKALNNSLTMKVLAGMNQGKWWPQIMKFGITILRCYSLNVKSFERIVDALLVDYNFIFRHIQILNHT